MKNNPTMEAGKLVFSISEAMAALGVSRPFLYELMKESDFPAFKVGQRVLIPRADLEDWLSRRAKESHYAQ